MPSPESLEITILLLEAIGSTPIQLTEFPDITDFNGQSINFDPIMLPPFSTLNTIKIEKLEHMIDHYTNHNLPINISPFLQLLHAYAHEKSINMIKQYLETSPGEVNTKADFFSASTTAYHAIKSTLLIRACQQLNISLINMLLQHDASPFITVTNNFHSGNPLSQALITFLNASTAEVNDLETIIVLLLEGGLKGNKKLALEWLNGINNWIKDEFVNRGIYQQLYNLINNYTSDMYYGYVGNIEQAGCGTCTLF